MSEAQEKLEGLQPTFKRGQQRPMSRQMRAMLTFYLRLYSVV